MNYPVWELTTYGGGFFIAMIAIVHVFVAHFAVGGGLFLVMLEQRAYRDDDAGLLSYVKKHSKFFVLLTMVFGGMTGVGIWWTISLLAPGATSSLIHIFVFGWAAEWVFFLAEIVALFIYFYTFGKMDRKNHMRIGLLYFACAWMSLFLINGIIGFMLTPGSWIENQDFWSGFFNPTFWPALVFRTGLALVMCGVFGFVTGAWLKDAVLRQKIMRTCAIWVTLPFILMILGGWWYINAIPELPRTIMFEKSPELATYLGTLFWFLPLLFIAALAMTIRMPNGLQKVAAFGVVAIAFVYFGAFEFVREGGRRPFIIYDHMYSNQVYVSDVPAIQQAGFLQTAKWTRHTSVTPENQQEVGADLFRIQCSSCHSIAGPLNDIKPLVRKYDSVFGLDAKLDGLGKVTRYMPPFFGDRAERWALAGYLFSSINGHPLPDHEPGADLNMGNPMVAAEELPVAIPPFDRTSDRQVLLAWSSLGIREISDSDDHWTIAAPGSDLLAQLVRRGDPPQRITSGVELHYQMEQDPQVNGIFQVDENREAFVANAVPVPAYLQDGSYHPYPLMRISAIDSSSGAVLASTRMVVPVATEMGCKNCHGGGWKVAGVTGISDATAEDVLAVHDRISGTDLLLRARQQEPQACTSCHGNPATGQAGDPALLNFSAAIHGWHANFLTDRSGSQACIACHAARPDGPTHFFREHHGAFMDCSNCHGTLEQHAVSLLKQEQLAGKSGATILLEELSTSADIDVAAINPRTPWLQQPDCLNCHEEFGLGMSVDAFNTWTDSAADLYRNRQDQMGVMMCQACHGSTHALYPAHNKYGRQRDIIQPLQYQGNDRPLGHDCTVCHTVQPEFEGHHPNSLRL